MSLFLFAFFTVYGSMHLYFFLKFRHAFSSLPTWFLFLPACFLALMFLSPILIHVIETYRQDGFTRFFARTTYLWMGFIFLFFCLSLTGDLCYAVSRLTGVFSGGTPLIPFPTAKTLFLGCSAMAVLICLYGFYEAYSIKIERLLVKSVKIPPDIERFRIVQISDLHLGITSSPKQINRIVDAVEQTNPDLLVCTGDMMDGQPDSFAAQLESFHRLNPPWGKYAITGNHEFYVGLERAISWLKWAGFRVLRGQTVNINRFLTLAGVDDHEAFHLWPSSAKRTSNPVVKATPSRFILLLKHRPVVDPESISMADLQLSGHTHKGQIFPFGLLTRLFFPYHSGHYTLTNGFQLYVSRGTGTWGPPIRVLAPPEITVIDLVPANPRHFQGDD